MFACVCRTLRPLGIPVAFFCLPSLSLGPDHPGTLVLVTLDDALMDVGERERVQGLTAMWKSEHSATLVASVPGSVGSWLFVHLFLPVNEPVPHVPSPTFQAARGLDSCVGTIFISSCASPGSECFSECDSHLEGKKSQIATQRSLMLPPLMALTGATRSRGRWMFYHSRGHYALMQV